MKLIVEQGILALALTVSAGCADPNWHYVDGTDGTGGSGGSSEREGTGGTGDTVPSTATENYVEASQTWIEVSCECLSELIEPLTVGACEAGHDVFFPLSEDFLLRPLSDENVACIDAAVEASEGEAAVECLTAAMAAVTDCFEDSEFTCDLDGIGACFNALEEDREACPELPDTWSSDVATCLSATPAQTVPQIAGLFSALCDCAECETVPASDPEFQACAVESLAYAVADEDNGEAAQTAVDCIHDLANRTHLCTENAPLACDEDYINCFGIFGFGITRLCPEDAGALFTGINEDCGDSTK